MSLQARGQKSSHICDVVCAAYFFDLGACVQITRPYFHTQALDDASLSNWRAYLTFEQEQDAVAAAAAPASEDGDEYL